MSFGLKLTFMVVLLAFIAMRFWPSTVKVIYGKDFKFAAILEPYVGMFLFTDSLFHRHSLGQGLETLNWPRPRVSVKTMVVDHGEELTYGFHVTWPEVANLDVTFSEVEGHDSGQLVCYDVAWSYGGSSSPYRYRDRPSDCFPLGYGHWYGGAEVLEQRWPMNAQRSQMQPYLTGDYLASHWRSRPEYGRYGSIVEPYWISSSGVGIYVSGDVTLHSSFNADGDDRLCLKSDRRGYVNAENSDDDLYREWLNYTVCRGENLLQVHRHMLRTHFARPRQVPDERTVRSPIWSTWARYKVHVNQTSVLEYATEIDRYGFPNSQIEIDDMYSTQYGDFDFDRAKFPDARAMTARLRELGFRVTVWVTPFANTGSRAFAEGVEKSYWAKTRPPYSVSSLTRWWQGPKGAAVLDVTNAEAVRWYVRRLKAFQSEYGIDSFKFDAGELDFLPRDMYVPPDIVNTNRLTDMYVRVTEQFGGMVEVRSGFRSQDVPVFFRMLDKDSVWGYDNGLRSMIPTALFMGVVGYPFVLPDMIGGNGYGDEDPLRETTIPDRELFVRWLEVSAFMPAMQFSIAPWQYDEEVVKIALKFVKIHETLVAPEVIRAGKIALKTGEPILRPLWWIDQTTESLTDRKSVV